MTEVEIKVIKGGRLIDGTGSEPIEKAMVIIEGSKIKAVGKNIKIPKRAIIIDATGKTIMPGLIDSHMHHAGFRSDAFHMEMLFRPGELSLIKSIYDSKALLAAGFTTVKDCGGTNAVFLKKAVAEGTIDGLPRIIAAGYMLSQTFGHGDTHHFPLECADERSSKHQGGKGALICDGVAECIKATRFALRHGAEFIKIMSSGGVMSEKDFPDDVQFNINEIKAIVETAAQVGKSVTTHCQNSRAAKNSIISGVKTIDHANEINDEVIELAKEHGSIFVSTLSVFRMLLDKGKEMGSPPWALEKGKKQWALITDSYKRIRNAGAILAAGTDFINTDSTLGKNALELDLLVNYCDFTPMDAIVAATKNGAMACFIGDKTGTIEEGKFADIIIVDGNPLEDITILRDIEKINLVMLEGKIEIDRSL